MPSSLKISKTISGTAEKTKKKKSKSKPNYNLNDNNYSRIENRHLNLENTKTYKNTGNIEPFEYKKIEEKIPEPNNAQNQRINQLINKALKKNNETGKFYEKGQFKDAYFQDVIVRLQNDNSINVAINFSVVERIDKVCNFSIKENETVNDKALNKVLEEIGYAHKYVFDKPQLKKILKKIISNVNIIRPLGANEKWDYLEEYPNIRNKKKRKEENARKVKEETARKAKEETAKKAKEETARKAKHIEEQRQEAVAEEARRVAAAEEARRVAAADEIKPKKVGRYLVSQVPTQEGQTQKGQTQKGGYMEPKNKKFKTKNTKKKNKKL